MTPAAPTRIIQEIRRAHTEELQPALPGGYTGNQARLRRLSHGAGRLQAKLEVGAVDDPLEAEADRVADQVMRMPDEVVQRKCAECEKEDKNAVRRTAASTDTRTKEAPQAVHDVLRSPGEKLDASTRAFFEPRLGCDLSAVRVHTGSTAASSAQSIGALAYTASSDLVFAPGNYAPHTNAGRRLLAHELAHVIQQRGAPVHESGNVAPPVHSGPTMISRTPATGHCSAPWTCAATPCTQPDTPGQAQPSTKWGLDLKIDTDVEKASDISSAADVGHTYVVFTESNGAQYSYGFYPHPDAKPDPAFHPQVFGCIVHTDTAHQSCVDYTEHYDLTQQQYANALRFAQLSCTAPPNYNVLSYNCTTFAVDVAKQAGQSPPSPKGSVGHGTFDADNPNTLKEGFLDQHVPTWRLTSDTEIRDWVAAHDALTTAGKPGPTIAMLPADEKARLLSRLLEGYVSDDDVAAFEKICSSITDATERKTVQDRVGPHVDDLYSARQKQRVQIALFGSTPSPAPAPPVSVPSPPPPK